MLADRERRPNPHLASQELGQNGYSVVEVAGDEVMLTVRTLDPKQVATAPAKLKRPLDELFGRERFRVRTDSAQLEREIDGEFLTWSRKEMQFV